MPTLALTPILLALGSALSFGISDYTGGIASRRYATFTVLIVSQAISMIIFLALALLTQDAVPRPEETLACIISGILGTISINLFYYGLSVSKMSLIAPASAVVTAAIPITFTLLSVGLPQALTLVGFVVALVAVWLIASGGSAVGIDWRMLWIPLVVGGITGIVFTVISQVTGVSAFYPLVVLRGVSLTCNIIMATLRRQPYTVPRHDLPLVLITGALNTIGIILFTLAVPLGRLDVTAVLVNLAPASTIFMAALLLKERLNRVQAVGVTLALIAIMLISV